MEHYNTSKQFHFPSDTRFAGKLLQLKRFHSMKAALQSVVSSADYLRFNFEDDTVAPVISGDKIWRDMEVVIKACSPLLLLLRLADSNAPTLCKVKGTVDLVQSRMIDTGCDSLTDRISAVFHSHIPDLTSDVANAAYVLDPQFINQSKNAGQDVMMSFWTVVREALHILDDDVWRQTRLKVVTELAAFRMKTGGFGFENYDTEKACAFWVTAGCHAPILKQLALRLCALPCSSSDAERNWHELKQNLTKTRNRVGSTKLEKMVFVRRFLRLNRAMAFDKNDYGFKDWVKEVLQQVANAGDSDDNDDLGPHSDDDDPREQIIFRDRIEDGEQGKINGKEPGQPHVPLVILRKDNEAKSWLFEKYIHMHFVDKNPSGDADAAPLDDENEWEHRVITNVAWWRSNGYAVMTKLRNATTEEQSHEKYLINDSLHQMIRSLPHNVKDIESQINAETTAPAAPAVAPVAADTVTHV